MLDLAAIAYMGGGPQAAAMEARGHQAVQKACAGLLTDYSQNPLKKPWTNRSTQISRCLTSSSQLYCHGKDRALLPIEMLFFQGYDVNVHVPAGCKPSTLADAAGQGICLPCLGTVVYALKHSGCLDAR